MSLITAWIGWAPRRRGRLQLEVRFLARGVSTHHIHRHIAIRRLELRDALRSDGVSDARERLFLERIEEAKFCAPP